MNGLNPIATFNEDMIPALKALSHGSASLESRRKDRLPRLPSLMGNEVHNLLNQAQECLTLGLLSGELLADPIEELGHCLTIERSLPHTLVPGAPTRSFCSHSFWNHHSLNKQTNNESQRVLLVKELP